MLFERPPAGRLGRPRGTEQLETARLGFADRDQTLALQHDLDLVPMWLAYSTEHEERLVYAIVVIPLQKLCDDLVRARVIENRHLG